MPMANWDCCLEILEMLESHVLWNLKILHEGSWKISNLKTIAPYLIMYVMPELKTLLKIAPKAHLELQAILI